MSGKVLNAVEEKKRNEEKDFFFSIIEVKVGKREDIFSHLPTLIEIFIFKFYIFRHVIHTFPLLCKSRTGNESFYLRII